VIEDLRREADALRFLNSVAEEQYHLKECDERAGCRICAGRRWFDLMMGEKGVEIKNRIAEALNPAGETTMKKLGEMTFEEAMPIYEAWHNKKPLEFLYTRGEWRDRVNPEDGLDYNAIYRVKATKPSIDWGHLKPEIVAIAEDEGGEAWCFEEKPNLAKGRWRSAGGGTYWLKPFASYVPGTCAPEDSLVLRPGVENDGWIVWHGGECPVAPNLTVKADLRSGAGTTTIAGDLRWDHMGFGGDIVRYRVVTPTPAQPGSPA